VVDQEIMVGVTGAAAGLIGTAVGALISWHSSDRRSKIQNTVELHREWQSEEMTAARMLSDRFVRDNPGKQLLQLELEEDPNAYANVLRVLNFFLRLSVLLKHKQLKSCLVPDLFGSYIVWWHTNCFEARLPAQWVIREDWIFLYGWLERNARSDALARWRENAMYARSNRQAGTPTSTTQRGQQSGQAAGPAPAEPAD
jgi:hypothetical protein